MHVISQNIDGGAIEADGGASAPVGPSVATPLSVCMDDVLAFFSQIVGLEVYARNILLDAINIEHDKIANIIVLTQTNRQSCQDKINLLQLISSSWVTGYLLYIIGLHLILCSCVCVVHMRVCVYSIRMFICVCVCVSWICGDKRPFVTYTLYVFQTDPVLCSVE